MNINRDLCTDVATVFNTEYTLMLQDKLFPYVEENLESYLSTKYDEEETQEDIAALRDLVSFIDSLVSLFYFDSKLEVMSCRKFENFFCSVYNGVMGMN